MATEVQITKNRSHLLYLRKVMSVLASGTGMSRRAIAEVHHAVANICSRSDGSLNIRLSASETNLVVEIMGAVLPGEDRVRNRLCRLVDEVGLTDQAVIRLTKCIRKTEPSAIRPPAYSPALGTTASQS